MSGGACAFTYAHYRETLERARREFSFDAFDARRGGASLVLRHDVDFCPETALRMAAVERELGIAATYFVLPHGPYNLLGSSFAPVREIVRLGHRLGLHYDAGFYAAHGLDAAAAVQRDAALLADRFETPVTVAAEHNPGLRAGAPVDVAPLVDAYGADVMRDRRYLSDSCQFWREGCFCGVLADCRPLQVLVHPIWWSDDGRSADRVLRDLTARRAAALTDGERAVFAHYASLAHLGNRELFERGT